MWRSVVVRHDESFLRVTERPMPEHVAEALNDLEEKCGSITFVALIGYEEDKFCELVVKIKEDENALR